MLALNPILLFDEADTVIAFNDMKDAIVKDRKDNSVTGLEKTTDWGWAYKTGEDWKERKVYALEKWRNGDKIADSKFVAYTFSGQGSLSLMPVALASAKIEPYSEADLSNTVIALSVSGEEQEALCYQIGQDGIMHIPELTITALADVEGIKSDFLKKGTDHTAVVQLILNDRVLWEGGMSSYEDNYVTELTCPDQLNVSVKAGDLLFLSVQLNAPLPEIAEEEPVEEDLPDIPDDRTGEDGSQNSGTPADTDIPLMTGFDSTYKIVYPANAASSQKDVINGLRVDMVKVFDADVLISTDKEKAVPYELLIGETNRSESIQVYKELKAGRKNNASDFIIRVVNQKLVIAGCTDYALQLATKYFMKNYCKTDMDKIKNTLNFVYRPALKDITIEGVSIASYQIRTEKYPSLLICRAAEEMSEFLIAQTGYDLPIVHSDNAAAHEILIGLTTGSGIAASVFKSQSLDNLKGYGLDDYKAFVNNKKLFIEAGSTYAANLAVTKTIEAIKKNRNLTTAFSVSGKYTAGEYTLTDGYAYTWGDEFSGNGGTLNRKRWSMDAYTKDGPWYAVNDPYYLASKASLEDADPTNDFGGPWSEPFRDKDRGGVWCVQEGTVQYGGKQNENYWIENNALVMQTRRTSEGYTSERFQTKGLMEFRYGILETRIIIASHNGAASAFWTRTRDGGTWVNEMDIYENFGSDQISPNLHTWGQGGAYHVDHKHEGQLQYYSILTPAKDQHFYDTYHYLSMEWTPEKICYYLDGQLYLSQEITTENWQAFAESTYVLFDCTAPSNHYNTWPGNRNPGNYLMQNINSFCEKMRIDYVRVYQINSRKYSLRTKK